MVKLGTTAANLAVLILESMSTLSHDLELHRTATYKVTAAALY